MKSVSVAICFETGEVRHQFFEGEKCFRRADQAQTMLRTMLGAGWTYRIIHDADAVAETKRLELIAVERNKKA